MPRDYIRDYQIQTAREDAAAWSKRHAIPYVVVKTADGFEARDEATQRGNYYVQLGEIVERYENGMKQ